MFIIYVPLPNPIVFMALCLRSKNKQEIKTNHCPLKAIDLQSTNISALNTLGVINKGRPHQRGEGSAKCRRYTIVNFCLQKAKICGHRGEVGQKTIKFCGRPLKTLTKLNKESYEAITTGFPTVEVELKKIVYQKEECRLGSAKAKEIDISDK